MLDGAVAALPAQGVVLSAYLSSIEAGVGCPGTVVMLWITASGEISVIRRVPSTVVIVKSNGSARSLRWLGMAVVNNAG